MSTQRSIIGEQMRMTLSLAFLIAAAPMVISHSNTYETTHFIGWALFTASLILPLWSRFTASFRKQG